MKYPICIEIFKQNCSDIISNLDSDEIVQANKFISLVVSINKKYPFVFLPDFIEDFMNGMFTTTINKKYQMHGHNDFLMVINILKFDRNRSKNPDLDNMKINLQNKQRMKQYEFLTSQIHLFYDVLIELFNCNVLNSLVGYMILDRQYIDNRDLKNMTLDSYEKFRNDVHVLYNDTRQNSFENYIHDDLNIKLNNIIEYMSQEAYLTSLDGDISLPRKYSTLSNQVYNMINEMRDGISYSSLRTKILREFPLLKIISNLEKINELLSELEKNNQIQINKGYWKYSPDSDQLFTLKNYDIKMKKIKEDIVSAGRTKFFGRNITPDQFISELTVLEQGDLDDLDDQVTRIAGLVLSDAALLQSPRENMDEFDFIVDLTHYNFRQEQEEMMKKIDFQATANIFHCKVMINENITMNVLSKLREIVPDGEQAAIFTCQQISSDVLQQIRNDRTVQIIDEEGIRNWCFITPTIPCRRHSVASVKYGDGAGKIVLVKSLNYESGLATVETAPDHVETTFQIGCLQEIDLKTSHIDDFEVASKTYFDFICLLVDLSPGFVYDGINTHVVAIHKTRSDLMKSIQPEIFDTIHPAILDEIPHYKNNRYVELGNTHVSVNLKKYQLNDSFACTCSHHLNEEHYYTLCRHQVAAIDHFCRDGLDWYVINQNIELFKKKLVTFQEDNIERISDVICEMINPGSKHLFKKYLQKYADGD